jgi:acyl-CoA synthetase (AMP-forming)/AMP-acid ligase II
VCEKHKVNQFYTAPTAIRALMGQGNEFVTKYDLSSLKLLGTVGRADQPRGLELVQRGRRRRALPHRRHLVADGDRRPPDHAAARRDATKPGSATKPFFGVQPVVLDADTGEEIHETAAEGVLCIKDSWPGQMRTVWGDHERFVKTYFSDYKGYYFTGDGCRRDEDGYYWITGRVDDVINVSGHRMGTAEVESALVAHDKVAEAAVVGYPHDIKGQGIYCYVTLMNGEEPTDELRKELQVLGPHRDRPHRQARPDPVGPRPAQDPLGQDHAPHPAQDRRERLRRARRHLDAGRSGGGRRPDRGQQIDAVVSLRSMTRRWSSASRAATPAQPAARATTTASSSPPSKASATIAAAPR